MRVVFEGASPQQPELYFRGPVLSTFDGREWQTLRSGFTQQRQLQANLQVGAKAFSYQITQEPNNRPWLLVLDGTLDKPAVPPGLSAFMTPELQWVTNRPITDLLRYKASSHTEFSHGPLRPEVALQDYLELPPGFNPRTLQMAVDMRRDPRYAQAGALPLVEAVMQRLREGGYTYTLEPGLFGKDTADEFWFDRKAGFCEHIASSFVILMRALDIPARIVTGYQGGQRNQVDNFWIIRQSDAHAWAEVWVENKGWVRVDPTSAVSPGRIGSLLRLQAPQGVLASAIGTVSPVLALNLRELWDAMNNRWNQWVLNYTQSKQLNLLRNLGFESPSWEDLGYILAGCIVVLSLLGASWTLLERSRQDPWLRLLHRAQQKILKSGVTLPAQAPPREMAQRLMAGPVQEPQKLALSQWLLKLEAWRYAPAETRAGLTLAQLQRELKKIRWPS
jgi:transglutaminase-like putative cysteine protease